MLWGTRVIAPEKLRAAVLKEIHSGHPGILKMKAIARQYVWWPYVDMGIEKVCKMCETCQLEQSMPCHVPLHPWEFPGDVWKRLHSNFAGPFMGHMFMIEVDAFSKWLEVYKMTEITSTATITRLKRLFASYGAPEQIVTDNVTTFGYQLRPRLSAELPHHQPKEVAEEIEPMENSSRTTPPVSELSNPAEPPDPVAVTLRRSQHTTRVPQRYQD